MGDSLVQWGRLLTPLLAMSNEGLSRSVFSYDKLYIRRQGDLEIIQRLIWGELYMELFGQQMKK